MKEHVEDLTLGMDGDLVSVMNGHFMRRSEAVWGVSVHLCDFFCVDMWAILCSSGAEVSPAL